MTADEIKTLLNLEPHPREGGFFAETWKSDEIIPVDALPARYRGPRSAGTSIYYLLEPGNFSEIHRLSSDEVFHFYLGDPVEMLQLSPDGSGRTVVIGNDLTQGMVPQVLAPKGVWQGSRLLPGGTFALLGCTVSPGFDYADYEAGSRVELLHRFPQYREHIEALTRVEAFGLF
jgi:predicted cupin superfamily sugar epimerase